MPSLTVSTPYPDAPEGVLDGVLFQTWYRQLGTVAVHIGIVRIHEAAQWLAANGRGGTVSWAVPGRVVSWTGLSVAPGVPDSPKMDVWLFGAALTQWNSVVLRKNWWQLYLSPAGRG